MNNIFFYYFHQFFFVLRFRVFTYFTHCIRFYCLRLLGMQIGKNSKLPSIYVTWPHKVKIGADCTLEYHIYFKYDGIWSSNRSIIIGNNNFIGNHCEFNIKKKVVIGDNCLIAAGCKFIDHDHGIAIGPLINKQICIDEEIIIDDNVWLGANVIVLKGVRIGEGAIVGAGAVVTRSIPSNEIWAGIPARKIGERK